MLSVFNVSLLALNHFFDPLQASLIILKVLVFRMIRNNGSIMSEEHGFGLGVDS
jgi:hypothetical protein